MTVEKARAAVQAAFATWTDAPGSYLSFVYGGLTSLTTVGSGESPRNVILWREDPSLWSVVGPEVLSLTTVTYGVTTATIIDADIEMNGAWFEFTTEDDVVAYDIRSAVVHEAGHLLGLDHSDDPTAVMNSFHLEGSLKKRTPSADDLDGVAAHYPVANDPGTCNTELEGDYFPSPKAAPGSAGCSSAGPGGGAPWAVPLAALALIILLLRRYSRRFGSLVCTLLVLVTAAPAQGYVLYTSCPAETEAECVLDPSLLVPLRWYTDHAEVVFDATPPGEIGSAEAMTTLQDSFLAWSALSCGGEVYPYHFTFSGPVEGFSIGYVKNGVNQNLVKWVSSAADWEHGPGVLALTSLTFDTVTGEVVDGDLELNDGQYRFSLNPASDEVDLKNTAVHEAGHFLGLDHSKNKLATMYDKAPLGETDKRDLISDDVKGYCALYGPGAPDRIIVPGGSVTSSSGGCQLDPRGGGQPLAGVALLLMLLLTSLTSARLRRASGATPRGR